jgi:hypothetical protein
MRLGGQTQHKFIPLGKTNLSPARETLKNAVDVAGGYNFSYLEKLLS